MGQQSNLTLNSVVYAAAGFRDGIAKWINRTAGVLAGFREATMRFREPQKGTQLKIDLGLTLPVLAGEDTACVCKDSLLRTSTVTMSIWVPVTSTQTERADVLATAIDFLSSAEVQDAVVNYDPVTS